MNKTEAIKATKQGAAAALILGVMHFLLVFHAIRSDASSGVLAQMNDSWNYIDSGILLACAFGLYWKSRLAAVLVLIYYVAVRIIFTANFGLNFGTLLSLAIMYLFFKAVIGAFAYDRHKKLENPEKSRSKWGYVLATPVVLVCVLVLTLGVLSETGITPSTRVLASEEVSNRNIELLREHDIISKQDEIVYFYSDGLISVLEGGTLLTDSRLISYQTWDDELIIDEMSLTDVGDVILEYQGDTLNDSIYSAHSRSSGRWFEFYLSVEQKGDARFMDKLRSRMAGRIDQESDEQLSALQ